MNRDLLMYVFEESETDYLSDLKFIEKDTIINILKDIKTTDFSLDEWKEFYLYIIGEEVNCDDREEIKEKLIKNKQ